MPARNPAVTPQTGAMLAELGAQLRQRRRALGVSLVTTAEAAGMSRVTLHRIEAGSPAVTIGAYLNAAAALGLQLTLAEQRLPAREASPPEEVPDEVVETTIRVGDFPQLRAIAWQLREDTALTGVEALQMYERNWRHVDQTAMDDAERALIQHLADTHSAGVLLV